MGNFKKVLIITYYFPPRPSISSMRFRGIAKYLPRYGWDPVFLTAKLPGEAPKEFHVIQTPYKGDMIGSKTGQSDALKTKRMHDRLMRIYSLLDLHCKILTIPIRIFRGILEYPDNQRHWIKPAVKVGREILKKEHFDAVLSASTPESSHYIAYHLQKEFNFPWIADFRDLWSQNHNYCFGPIRHIIDTRVEKKILKQANVLTTVSQPLIDKLKTLHETKKIQLIRNGFDPDDMITRPLLNNFVITYTGSLHSKQMKNFSLLLKSISELISNKLLDINDLEIRIFGPERAMADVEAKKYNLENVIRQHGRVAREYALDKQRESQLLLHLDWDDVFEAGIYTGKIFEYLCAKRPIISIGQIPKGVIPELLEHTHAGYYLTNETEIKETITHLYQSFKKDHAIEYTGSDEAIHDYSHCEMARHFSDILNNLTKGSCTA